MCWILKVQGQPAYYLSLRDLHDLPHLIECLSFTEDHDAKYYEELAVFVGSSSQTPAETCPGVTVPVLAVDQLFVFKLELMQPETSKMAPGADNNYLFNFFAILVQTADNLGDTDETRARNYIAVRYKPVYEKFAENCMKNAPQSESEWHLAGITAVPSRLSRLSVGKRIVDVVFSYQSRKTSSVQKYYVRVDVSHLFPMLVSHYLPYVDR